VFVGKKGQKYQGLQFEELRSIKSRPNLSERDESARHTPPQEALSVERSKARQFQKSL
jgi:hypothetical protein